MKLSDIIRYKNQIDQMLNNVDYRWTIDSHLDELMRMVRTEVNVRNMYEVDVQRKVDGVFNSLHSLEQELKNISHSVNTLIEEIQPQYFEKSYKWYVNEMQHETIPYILNRKLAITDEEYEIFRARVKSWSDWQYPAVCFRPATEEHVLDLVSSSPLYLVDQDYDLLVPSIERFNKRYQRHLRPYVVKESESEPMMNFLPDNQFGLVVAYNFFNFRPFEIIKHYLSELLTKLRPGGAFIFTFNNCDYANGVMLSESIYCCYTPGEMLINLAKMLGYEHSYTYCNDTLCWVELCKPGELTTLRGGQSLAKIIPKQL
jgi:SAM-dependent methyltransferase